MAKKIVDCFTFFNELDLLEFRLKLLAPRVHRFVIAEAGHSFSGNPKPYFIEENRERFKPWWDKIHYIQVKLQPGNLAFDRNLTAYDPQSAHWKMEIEQRNALAAARQFLGKEDIALIGDLDEIPDPRCLDRIDTRNGLQSLSQLFHYYFMNCQNIGEERWWRGTIACSMQEFAAQDPQTIRDQRYKIKTLKKAGWHFSFLGGIEKIRKKIDSFAHSEFNREEFTSEENIRNAIEKGEDIFKRPGVKYKFYSLYYYPDFLRELMLQYPDFIHEKGMLKFHDKILYGFKRIFTA